MSKASKVSNPLFRLKQDLKITFNFPFSYRSETENQLVQKVRKD